MTAEMPGPSPRVDLVFGARPNLPKVAPLWLAFGQLGIECRLVDTGQHYDPALSSSLLAELDLPAPTVRLGVGSGSHATQTARIMLAYEEACDAWRPDAVLVVGDTNSTLATALVAAKLGLPVVHVEAGLRNGDRAMPEELNRRLVDHLAERLYTHCADADANLRAEGIPEERVLRVGNVMIDTLLAHRGRARRPELAGPALEPGGYGLVTLHRPTLVDDLATLEPMLDALATLSAELPLLFPAHPRTRARLVAAGLVPGDARGAVPIGDSALWIAPPLPYRAFLWAMDHARLVLTDSGGVQEETTVLGVPCLTVRDTTERPVTVTEGTNRVVGTDPPAVLAAAREALARDPEVRGPPDLWDGSAAERIGRDLLRWLR